MVETIVADAGQMGWRGIGVLVVMRLAGTDGVFIELDLLAAYSAVNHRREFSVSDRQRFLLPGSAVARRPGAGEPDLHGPGIGTERKNQKNPRNKGGTTHEMVHKCKLLIINPLNLPNKTGFCQIP